MSNVTVVAIAVARLKQALEQNPPVCPSIGRSSLAAIPEGVDQAVVVKPGGADRGDDQDMRSGLPAWWSVQVAVELYARVTGTVPADEAVDPLLAAVYARLAADPTLGHPSLRFFPTGLDYDYEKAGDGAVCATLTVTVRAVCAPSQFTPQSQ